MSGDTVHIQGNGNVGIVKDHGTGIVHHPPQDLDAALRRLVDAMAALQPEVDAEDGATLSRAAQTIESPQAAGPGLLPVLKEVAGIAAVAGGAGQAVLEAVAQARALFGG